MCYAIYHPPSTRPLWGEKGTSKVTIKDVILANKDRSEPVEVMVRGLSTYPHIEEDYLVGYFSYEKGRITPLDGDSYSLDEEVINYDWLNSRTLIVYEDLPLLTAEEFDKRLKEYREKYAKEIKG